MFIEANYFNRDGYRTFIVHFPCQNMKTLFLYVQTILENIASNEADEAVM